MSTDREVKMNSKENEEWLMYCQEMYQRNAIEREAWKEAAKTYEEYVKENREFLTESFLK